jgi:low temperature requirement protein LtrA
MTGGDVSSTDRLDSRASGDEELRVSTLELFFDLVFVFTLTQLTALLAADPSAETAGRAVLIFIVLFWMYGGYVWLTNRVSPDRPAQRLLMILGMGAFLVCALAIPEAFDGGGVAFGLGYLLAILVHAWLYGQAFGASVVMRFAPFNVASALSVTIAGFLDGPGMYVLWGVAILIQFITPSIAARVAPRFDIRSGHFVERHGLLLIVAFGESVVAIGIGIAGRDLDPGLFAIAVMGLALAAALWWAYFVGDEEGARRAMDAAHTEQRFRLAINGYFYAYIPMLLGVITMAAGVKDSIGLATERLDVGPAVILAVGVAMYLGGDVAFRLVMGIRPIGFRAGGVAAALGTVVLGVSVAAAVQLLSLVVIVVGMLAIESKFSEPRVSLAGRTA